MDSVSIFLQKLADYYGGHFLKGKGNCVSPISLFYTLELLNLYKTWLKHEISRGGHES